MHGRGRGHAVRTRAVLARLDTEGHEIHVFGGGQARDILGDRADFTAVRLTAPGRDLLPSIAARIPEDRERLERLAPDLVITDSDLSSLHVAALLRIPTIALGHGLVFGHCRLPRFLPLRGVLRETLNSGSSSWLAWRKVVVHFADAPIKTESGVLARPDLRDGLEPSDTHEDFVLTYFRDDNGAAVLERLVRRGESVVCFGQGPVPSGVTLREPSAAGFAEALGRCKAVVASAGNHLPAECAMLGKPMLALYKPGDVEQTMNAMLHEHAGYGPAGALNEVDDALLDRFFEGAREGRFPRPGAAEALRAMPPVSEVVSALIAERMR